MGVKLDIYVFVSGCIVENTFIPFINKATIDTLPTALTL